VNAIANRKTAGWKDGITKEEKYTNSRRTAVFNRGRNLESQTDDPNGLLGSKTKTA
jgi:hypothetical protein